MSRNRVFVWFLAFGFAVGSLSGCKDSTTQVTEGPKPPSTLNGPGRVIGLPDVTVTPPAPMPLPSLPSRRPAIIPAPVTVPPLPGITPARVAGPKRVKFDLVVPDTTNLQQFELGEDDFRECLKVNPGAPVGGVRTVKPLWIVIFEKPRAADATDSTESFQLNFYGPFTAGRSAWIRGNGRTLFQTGPTSQVFRFSEIIMSSGGDALTALRFENRYQNAVIGRDRSNCEISIDQVRDHQLKGSFRCDKLANDKQEWMIATGEFECPYRESTLYPPQRQDVVNRP